MIFFLLLILNLAHAEVPNYWSSFVSIQDRHEFYQNNEVINKPENSWQLLFSVVLMDKNLHQGKDCVFYRVPGEAPGVLKIKAVALNESCEKYLLTPGDREVKDIKSLQFMIDEEKLILDFTLAKYRTEKWEFPKLNRHEKKQPELHQSSADYKGAKIFFLSNQDIPANQISPLKDQSLCHNINDECEEVSPSICSQCKDGWFEKTNGCAIGPKYCGTIECGHKGGPACRRGMKWQRIEREFDCRTDSSFAYCMKGLEVHCQGRSAYCR